MPKTVKKEQANWAAEQSYCFFFVPGTYLLGTLTTHWLVCFQCLHTQPSPLKSDTKKTEGSRIRSQTQITPLHSEARTTEHRLVPPLGPALDACIGRLSPGLGLPQLVLSRSLHTGLKNSWKISYRKGCWRDGGRVTYKGKRLLHGWLGASPPPPEVYGISRLKKSPGPVSRAAGTPGPEPASHDHRSTNKAQRGKYTFVDLPPHLSLIRGSRRFGLGWGSRMGVYTCGGL